MSFSQSNTQTLIPRNIISVQLVDTDTTPTETLIYSGPCKLVSFSFLGNGAAAGTVTLALRDAAATGGGGTILQSHAIPAGAAAGSSQPLNVLIPGGRLFRRGLTAQIANSAGGVSGQATFIIEAN